jgi:threonine aldolase
MKTTFASDNYSGVHPAVMEQLQSINTGHQISYGNDDYTKQATETFHKVFGSGISVLFLANGTATNILSLKLLLTRPYEACIVPETSHIFNDESGAAQSILGTQLFPVATSDGKLTIASLDKMYARHHPDNPHSALPKVVSIAQLTEYGTVYSTEEIKALADYCHEHDMYLHMDGNRLANAAVALKTGLREISRDVGVDVLSFGGAKNGLLNAEAVIVFNAPKNSLTHAQKQVMQLTSKMRYISAQFIPYLEQEIWKTNAQHSNQLSRQLADGLKNIQAVTLTQPVQANHIFIIMPPELKQKLHRLGHHFQDWDSSKHEIRLVTSWDNSEDDVKTFLADINRLTT